MPTIRTDYDALPWLPCTEMFGEAAVYRGKPIIEAKTLADRRREGGGISYLLRFSPPAGKLIKVVAIARSDEHIFNLVGRPGEQAGRAGRRHGRLFDQP